MSKTEKVELKVDYVYLNLDNGCYFYVVSEDPSTSNPYPMFARSFGGEDVDWRKYANSDDCREIGHRNNLPEYFV